MSEQAPQPVEGLEVHEVEDGLVVFDPQSDRVHYLNPTASLVFALSDGKRSDTDLAGLVQSAWKLDGPPTDEVSACVTQLRDEGVLR
jgi:Coenzyme PQQ synthesis protein D (PqqD)